MLPSLGSLVYSSPLSLALPLTLLKSCLLSSVLYVHVLGFLGGSAVKSICKAGAAGDTGSVPGLGRTPGRGNGNPLQYSCLENPMDRGAWPATVHGVAKSQTQLKRLSKHSRTCTYSHSPSVPSPLPTWWKGHVFMPLHLPPSPPPPAQVVAYS